MKSEAKSKPLTKAEFMRKLRALELPNDDARNRVACAMLGHSKIQSYCFGYYSCARCEEQVGDSLGGGYTAGDVVIVGHNCDKCHFNFKALTWRDKIFTPDPFKEAT